MFFLSLTSFPSHHCTSYIHPLHTHPFRLPQAKPFNFSSILTSNHGFNIYSTLSCFLTVSSTTVSRLTPWLLQQHIGPTSTLIRTIDLNLNITTILEIPLTPIEEPSSLSPLSSSFYDPDLLPSTPTTKEPTLIPDPTTFMNKGISHPVLNPAVGVYGPSVVALVMSDTYWDKLDDFYISRLHCLLRSAVWSGLLLSPLHSWWAFVCWHHGRRG